MISELDAITDAEQILSSHWAAICASSRSEAQIAAQWLGKPADFANLPMFASEVQP